VTVAGVSIDLADLQGDILRAYGNDYAHTAYLFFRIDDAGAGRAWLRALLPRVTTAEPWRAGKPPTTLNLAVTADGLRALGVPDAVLASFSHEFRAGMPARAETLGDAGPSDPAHWEPELRGAGLHVLATVNALDEGALAHEITRLRSDAASAGGVAVAYEQRTQLLPGSREHFGYADGFAQPALAGGGDDATDRRIGGGVPEAQGAWRALAPGEFVLGYEDEDTRVDPKRTLPSAPADPFGRSGTYMVWRKLYQDVALFRHVLREAAALYHGGDHEKLAAKVVGRWPNGTPLVLSPDAPIEDFDAKAASANAFRYAAQDPDGRRCPLGAHIRRTNPRDALGFDGLLSFRHRIIRRGMPYGRPLAAEATEDDHVDRGLVFVCFNASISRQFEGIQAQWINDGNVFGLGHDSDFLMGDPNGTGKMTVEGDPPFFLGPQGPFVATRGGAYLFVPGIAALAALAG
jgi:Dyp-type peroxidase family